MGHEASRYVYLPYGEIDVADSNLGYAATKDYTGQARDPESGLMYYHARYYDPSMGRFLTADSIIPNMRDAQSFNRYAYVRGNPVKYDDPTGHCEWYQTCNVASWIDQKGLENTWKQNVTQPMQSATQHYHEFLDNDLPHANKQFNDFISKDPATAAAFIACAGNDTCTGAVAWSTGDKDIQDSYVDYLATKTDIEVALVAPPGTSTAQSAVPGASGSAIGGFIRGFGHSIVHGKTIYHSLEAGSREAIIEGMNSAISTAGLTAGGMLTSLIFGLTGNPLPKDLKIGGSAALDQYNYSHPDGSDHYNADCDRDPSRSCGL